MATQDLPPDILEQLKNPSVRRLLAETMMGEAGGEGPRGQQAVEDVILNRAIESGMSIQDVINAPNQFTSMGRLGSRGRLDAAPAASLAPEMSVIDNPNAAWTLPRNVDAFLNPQLVADMTRRDPTHYHGLPNWGKGTPAETIGRHQFFVTGYKGGPSQTSSQNQTVAGLDPNSLVDPKVQAAVDANLAAQQANLPNVIKGITDEAAFKVQLGQQLMGRIAKSDELNNRFQQSLDALMKDMPDEEKLRQQELAKVSDQPMDPTRALGEMLPMLAAIGGAFTKAGVTGSLNAAAAAMNAAKSNDQDALKRAHELFADKLQETTEKFSIEHQALTEMIANNRNNAQDMIAGASLLGAQFESPALIQAALSGNIRDIVQAADMGTKTLSTLLHMQSVMLANQQRENGKPVPYTNPVNGKVALMWTGADGVHWTDTNNNPIDPPDELTHIQSGRVYGALPSILQAADQESIAAGKGPLTSDQRLQVVMKYNRENATVKSFATGKQGDQIQAFNTGIAHLDQLQGLADALQNGDIRMFNELGNAWATETGSEVPTDFDAVKRIVGQEVNKAIVAGGGGEAERKEAAEVFNKANSPQQLSGAIKQVEGLMGSQLESLRLRYKVNSGQDNFNDFLTTRSQNILGAAGADPDTPVTPDNFSRVDWEDIVTEGRQRVESGQMDVGTFKQKLHEHWPYLPPEIIDQAAAGLK